MSQDTPVWFITACSSGFGKYIALEAVSRGHKVIATARKTSGLTELEDAGAFTLALDVTWPQEELNEIAKQAYEKYGRITHVVNAAGYMLSGAVEETSPEEDFATFNTNVFGTLNVLKAMLPYLRSTPAPNKAVANFGSIASWVGGPGYALYNGTKFAISGITEALRPELAPFGITASVIEPGFFKTAFLQGNALVKSQKQMKEYDESAVGEMRRGLEKMNAQQRGDVVKGSRVIVDMLTRTGVAEGKTEIPVRILLGADAPGVVRGKLEQTENEIKEWESAITATDRDDFTEYSL